MTAIEPAKGAASTVRDAGDAASNVIDEQLARYRSMRDFQVTAEPAGSGDKTRANEKGTQYPFCVQKHAASHLHYDFRLGWNGVLKSWAVAKGPSYVTADKRLAVQVEDHPMEYGGFEGVIPQGQYGGGTVMLWDQGTWVPQAAYPDVDAGLRNGSLKFSLQGEKLKGKWALIRMKPRPKETKPTWLLIKEHDEFEGAATAPAVTEAEPDSVVTGRSLEQIARSEDHVWNSKETAKPGQAWYRQQSKSVPDPSPAEEVGGGVGLQASAHSASGTAVAPRLSGSPPAVPQPAAVSPLSSAARSRSGVSHASTEQLSMNGTPERLQDGPRPSLPVTSLPRESQPRFLLPQLAQHAETPPSSAGWLHELKLDGYRIQARKEIASVHSSGKNAGGPKHGAGGGDPVQLFTRTGLDWTHRMRELAAEVARLPASSATLDGEVVVLAPDGTTSFADLQAAFQHPGDQGRSKAKHLLTYFVFDLLHLNGHNPRNLPLSVRKAMLAELLAGADPHMVRLSEHLDSDGPTIFREACKMRAEGIVSKLASAKYCAGRSAAWLKCKCLHEQELVIGGFTLPAAGHSGMHGVGALLLGYYAVAGPQASSAKLIYAGRTGTGFTQKTHKFLRDRLEALAQSASPFENPPAEVRKGAHWVRPELVAQVRFATWTADNLVRQAAFLGLREDKAAGEVVRETSAPTPKRAAPTAKATAVRADARLTPALPPSATGSQWPAVSEPQVSMQQVREQRGAGNEQPAGGARPPIRLTHPAKVLDPESGLTKQALADYYYAIAPQMLAQIADRPLSLVRCPDGSAKPCFFQKHVNAMLPPGIGSVPVPDKKTGKIEPYITLTGDSATPAVLASLAQLGVLEVHPWGARNEDIEHPDRLIFDLDPDESLPWAAVTEAANEVRERLKTLGLASFLKTTGGKGLHVVVPMEPTLDFAAAKGFAYGLVLAMERASPARYLTKMTKAARTGRIYLDYLRNERGATAVAAYSPRARAGAAVSVPLAWAEIASGPYAATRPSFLVVDFAEWQGRLQKDPWAAIGSTRQSLPAASLKG